jgi:hypothetical protein
LLRGEALSRYILPRNNISYTWPFSAIEKMQQKHY